MLKTLLSSACTNDCRYCPLRAERDTRRVTLAPEEIADAFMHYVRARKVFGLFLSSGASAAPTTRWTGWSPSAASSVRSTPTKATCT
jgi:predicted DNA-binding helix-hairpin-helix protein